MPEPDVATALAVLDWRRRTHDLYRAVRDADDPASAHELWCERRNDLFAGHPASPIPPEERDRFTRLPVAPYDERYRVEVAIGPADEGAFDADTGTDGVVPFRRLRSPRALIGPRGRATTSPRASASSSRSSTMKTGRGGTG